MYSHDHGVWCEERTCQPLPCADDGMTLGKLRGEKGRPEPSCACDQEQRGL